MAPSIASDMKGSLVLVPALPNPSLLGLYPVRMSSQPRRAVIDRAWRAIGPGVEVLSGDDGAPLRRTVKRIIDPLVLRLRTNPAYSAPFVSADIAAEMFDVITAHADQLRCTAAWFTMMKLERRRQRADQR